MTPTIRSTLVTGLLGLVLTGTAWAKDVVIDVRSAAEFAGGHVSGALNLPHNTIAQTISQAGVAKDDRVLLYCRSGSRSSVAQRTLQSLGYTQVHNLGSLEQARKALGKQ